MLGVLITVVFTAANVYFGLKAGLTFATSIPAAVISMGLLRRFAGSTIQENNIVQTIASAAGTLASVIFVLPGLVMIGWWTGFPFGITWAICAFGGVLGVLYSIPLRRALVLGSDLPFPEGVACAEVLKVGGHAGGGTDGESRPPVSGQRESLRALVVGSFVSAGFAIVIATQMFASDLVSYFRFGNKNGATGYDFSLSFALFAVGHLVGLWVGLAMLAGALISWAGAVPYLTSLSALSGDSMTVATDVWRHQVRFIGAGAIGVAAVWTLIKMGRPVYLGIRSAIATSKVIKAGKAAELPRTERDMPIAIVGATILLMMLPIGWLLGNLSVSSGLAAVTPVVVAGGVGYILLIGFFVATVSGFMAGLIGASNSPISGVGILVVVGASLFLVAVAAPQLTSDKGPALVAYALFVTAIVLCVATISNDNLQDLKTGQLVDATPWRQQVALLIGVAAGAVVIPPVLDLLNHAYGFAGVPGVDETHALAAPQAALISALAEGVIRRNLDWAPIRIGGLIGIALIFVDEALRRKTRAHLSPLAVGMGMYLPTAVTLITVVGAVAGWIYERRAEQSADPAGRKQLGVLLASGLIVGESLIGVVLAAIVVVSGQAAPLAIVGSDFAKAAIWIGAIAFVGLAVALYRWVERMSDQRTQPNAKGPV